MTKNRSDKSFWLASRGEAVLDDFDGGGIRRCVVESTPEPWFARGIVVVGVAPPIVDSSGRPMDRVALLPRYEGSSIAARDQGVVEVHVSGLLSNPQLSTESPDSLRWEWWGQIADEPSLFSHTDDEEWDHDLRAIEGYLEERGSPLPPIVGGMSDIANLIGNIRHFHDERTLPDWVEERLNTLSNWTW